MMNFPLLLKTILYRANLVYPNQEIVTRTAAGTKRYTYRDMSARAAQLAHALDRHGVLRGAHVASFAWNNDRHLELYYGVPCSGRVLHTVNIRLSPEQIVYTVNHAEDSILFIDEDLVPLIAPLASRLPTVKTYVILTDERGVDVPLPGAVSYEEFVAELPGTYDYPELDENAPAILAYTSATTGDPKGVLYSHRGLYLHALTFMTGYFALDDHDVSMPIVPMFHVNAWGRPFSDLWSGAKIVLPGPRPTPKGIADLIQSEGVTFSAGVPTVWMGMLQHVRQHPGDYDFRRVRMLISGGSALPESLVRAYQEELGVALYQGYGQTETSPVTFLGAPKQSIEELPMEEQLRYRTKTGLLIPGLEMRLVDTEGNPVLHDGKSRGELLLRGPWVLDRYYNDPDATASAFVDGWFKTGDIATMDEHGYLQIVDRSKDLIKSGGEWISSVDLENLLMAHKDVVEAAVIGIPDPLWQERPLAVVVVRPDARDAVTPERLRDFLGDHVAKFWIPDAFSFVDEIPKTSVGKFSKKALREQYQNGELQLRR
ncbi:long-chain fatty acid--CoA ligase [Alicyclobacillus fastidiosus]|uniref:Long-chain fatty acid--CoA ligase n=1 Tax=Alicyclobacillus fastidiosus TaxID=392011 RepID=A0ABY6ZDT9_9BACL|nr:long-chain fatty acid--CoA ligase [Alicyclobacillus fastidiosus]WAH40963.1 long-chain fatty acid--CoA ligase [Alicyclobacillus fastidiosus]GMA62477.1 long-chain-fatty-acid--CoA ligase [Alicyclobacillus fastidiosus]